MIDFSILTNNFDSFLEGFKNTVIASGFGLIGSFFLGTFIAVLQFLPNRFMNFLGRAYTEFFRNIPVIIIVLMFYIGFPAMGIIFSGFTAGTIGLIVYTSAFIAEAIRAGILSVPTGQMEAARSSGLSFYQAMLLVILPQAIKIVVPPLGNQFINLVKNSSVLGLVAGMDLMYFGDAVSATTFVTFDVYIIVALFYLVLTVPLSISVRWYERKLARNY